MPSDEEAGKQNGNQTSGEGNNDNRDIEKQCEKQEEAPTQVKVIEIKLSFSSDLMYLY